MKKIIFILSLIFLVGCGNYIPKNEQRAKNKISLKKDQIERIAAYHKLNDTWTKIKTVELITPIYRNDTIIDVQIIDNSRIDSILINNCKDNDLVKKYIYKEILPKEPIKFEDEFLVLTMTLRQDGVRVEYKIKEQELTEEVPCEETIIDVNIKWYKEKGMYIFFGSILVSIFIINYLVKKFPFK